MTFRSRFHRGAAIIAGSMIGLGGSVLAAGTAGATTPIEPFSGFLNATPVCTDSGWEATWRLQTTDTQGRDGVLSKVRATVIAFTPPPGQPDAAAPNAPAFAKLVDGAVVTANGSLSEKQKFGPGIAAVRLTLTVTWRDGETDRVKVLQRETYKTQGCLDEVPAKPVPPAGEDPGDRAAESATASPAAPAASAPSGAVTERPAGSGGGAVAESASLPVTGAAAGTVAGAAGALLAVGSVLFFLTRRRRTNFTA